MRFKMRARISLPDPERLSAEGREIYNSILASRGSVDGPFLAWLHVPKLADPAQKLGAFCRYGTRLAPIESEMLILLVAITFRCEGEWQIHAPMAAKAGLADEVIADIRAGRQPELPPPRLDVLYAFARELLTTQRVTERAFTQALARFGTEGVVELTGLLGYYAFVAMTLNAFEMTSQSGEAPGA